MDRRETILELGLNRVLAHQTLFAHRHPYKTPAFHVITINDWHSDHPRVETMAFRDGAKSTIAEEAIILQVGFREFRNGLVLGETQERANERVEAVRHEIDTNDMLFDIFGDLRGPTWAEGELVFANGIRLLAMGRGGAIRGIKFHDARPDMLFVDDLENDESVKSPVVRRRTKIWFTKVLTPACDPNVRMRVAATPLDPDALAMDLERDPAWLTRKFPIEYPGPDGKMVAQWPDRFPLAKVEEIKTRFRTRGLMREFNMEYMLEVSADSDKVFLEKNFRVEPRVRTWEAVFGMYDPARTTGPASATTGFAAWSWVGPRLVVWDSWGRRLLPDEIVGAMFEFNDVYRPVWIGVEEDGLNEWLLQPIRQQMARRGVALPLKAVKAPRGKLDFIRGLQPYFTANEVWFAGEQPELKRQLLNFPTGEIDAPNALAYAPRMRGGAPIYEDFGRRHVMEDMRGGAGLPVWLCVNATAAMVTGAAAQMVDGSLKVLADFVREGDAGSELLKLVQDAQVEAGREVRLVCGPTHFDPYNNVGLIQAAKRIPLEMRKGVAPERGRAYIRDLLKRETRMGQAVTVSGEARWTLNGFSVGYSRAMQKGGSLADYAEEGAYRTLLEGLESFVGLMNVVGDDDEREDLNYAYTPDGRRYVSALAKAR